MTDSDQKTMTDRIAEQALLRLAAQTTRKRNSVESLPHATQLEIGRGLLGPADRKVVFLEAAKPHGVKQSSFYRFAHTFERAAVQVHRDMIGGTLGVQLLEPADVAKTLRISHESLRQLIDQGELPAVQVGPELRIEPAAVRAYIKTHPADRDKRGRYTKRSSPKERRPCAERRPLTPAGATENGG